jgi:hypothetical protein
MKIPEGCFYYLYDILMWKWYKQQVDGSKGAFPCLS